MRIAITGSTGLIGTALRSTLAEDGHTFTRLVRSRSAATRPGAIFWQPAAGAIDGRGLEGHDAVIHLAAESLFNVWTPDRRRRIRESRVQGTGLLSRTLAGLERKPQVLLMASAVGYYGDRPDAEELTEDEPSGTGFLAEVVRDWEAAADPARQAGIRVVTMRSGVMLSRDGGALRLMLLPFKLGLGGTVGSGEQMFSWLALSELPHIVRHLLDRQDIEGPVNVTSPRPVPQVEFIRAAGRALGRPTPLRIPAFVARLLPGGFGEETILVSVPAVPRRLLASGYEFHWPDVEGALRHELGRE